MLPGAEAGGIARVRQFARRLLVELQIAGDNDVRFGRNRQITLRIRLGLHRNQIEHLQQRTEKTADFPVALDRVVRHPAVHQRDRNAALPRLRHQVRPDFGFENHQHRRLQHRKSPPDHPEEIDRAENHRRIRRRLIPHELLTGRGRGR